MDWITTIVSIPAILAAVNIFRMWGLPVRWAPLMAVLTGAIIAGVASYIQMASFANMPAAIMIGVVTGLSASGVYDITKNPELMPAQEAPVQPYVPEPAPVESVLVPVEQPPIQNVGAY